MRALGVFWLIVLAALGGGAFALHRLGPPAEGIPPGLARAPVEAPSLASVEPPLASAPPAPEPGAGGTAHPSETVAGAQPPPAAIPPAASPGPPAHGPVPPAEAQASFPSPDHDAAHVLAAAPMPIAPVTTDHLPSAPEPPPLPSAARRTEAPPERPIAMPDAALQEPSRYGPLPKLGPEGRTSIRTYGRPFDRTETRPRVALLVGNVGLSASLSEEAIARLPPATGLAFSPYAMRPDPILERARLRGMEVLTAIPMEPANYPTNDPGDRALLTTLGPPENGDRLAWIMSRISGQVGAIGALGSMRGERFAALPELIGGVQDVLRERGLLYVDPRPGAANPARAWGRSVDVVVDEPATRGEIDRRLAELERIAREKGSALGLAADVSPVLVDRVAAWAAGLEARGLVMAPVTALIRRPEETPR